jgi:hypothetical protein
MTQSRAKGKRAELEAADAVGKALGIMFHRTQQYNGLGKGDIEPVDRTSRIHFEVKHYKAGLTWWTKRAKNGGAHNGGDLWYCTLSYLPYVLNAIYVGFASPTCGFAERWMEQAARDAGNDRIPVVICRQDRGPWLVVWRHNDTQAIIEAMKELRNAPIQI